jgi:hypothetical protein
MTGGSQPDAKIVRKNEVRSMRESYRRAVLREQLEFLMNHFDSHSGEDGNCQDCGRFRLVADYLMSAFRTDVHWGKKA